MMDTVLRVPLRSSVLCVPLRFSAVLCGKDAEDRRGTRRTAELNLQVHRLFRSSNNTKEVSKPTFFSGFEVRAEQVE